MFRLCFVQRLFFHSLSINHTNWNDEKIIFMTITWFDSKARDKRTHNTICIWSIRLQRFSLQSVNWTFETAWKIDEVEYISMKFWLFCEWMLLWMLEIPIKKNLFELKDIYHSKLQKWSLKILNSKRICCFRTLSEPFTHW